MVVAAFDVLENEPERIEKLWQNTRFWKRELGLLGFDIGGKTTPASETPITPIIIGDGKLTMDFSRELFKEGVLGTGIAFPTVPEGKARIRTIMTATHTQDELQQALEVLKRVGKRMAIVELNGRRAGALARPLLISMHATAWNDVRTSGTPVLHTLSLNPPDTQPAHPQSSPQLSPSAALHQTGYSATASATWPHQTSSASADRRS